MLGKTACLKVTSLMQIQLRSYLGLIIILLLLSNQRIPAQISKVEIGGHVTLINLKTLLTKATGVGGRFTYNVHKLMALEAEGNFIPNTYPDYYTFERGTWAIQGLFGVKSGLHFRRFGIFGKVRPGFIHFNNVPIEEIPFPTPSGGFSSTTVYGSKTRPAVDAGGTIEISISRRTILRFDLGDTISKHRYPGYDSDFSTHNLQFSVGISARFLSQ